MLIAVVIYSFIYVFIYLDQIKSCVVVVWPTYCLCESESEQSGVFERHGQTST